MHARTSPVRFLWLLTLLLLFQAGCSSRTPRVLVFTGTDGYRHGSIEAGVAALQEIGTANGFVVDTTEQAAAFTEENLQRYAAVVFLNTSGDVLNYAQQGDFERFIQAGGGFVGIHAAAETEPHWSWYGDLVGARYAPTVTTTPGVQAATLTAVEPGPAGAGASPASWEVADEWQPLEPDPGVDILLRRDASGPAAPVAWRHAFDGGRAFYTAAGDAPETFEDAAFREHLAEGLRYAVGDAAPLNYENAHTSRLPDPSRFSKIVLAQNLNEPTELELLGDGRVLFTERKGALKLYDPEQEAVRVVAALDVHTVEEDGLMGLALDPGFDENHWVYLYYSPAGPDAVNRLSRFVFNPESETLDFESESILLEVATQRVECCHTGGSLEFGPDGLLFLSTGDNTNPFESDGFAPADERPGRSPFDAQGSSGNTNDLRGKILRIKPEPDGTYSIPDGNLFPEGTPDTRPEIYVMGNRNPYRISVDQKTGYLYWGEVGPDARAEDPARGPRGHDEVNQARQAGNFGWPFFVGNNKAYRDYDFATGMSGPAHDAQAPVNDSPNNTGLQELPPAQPAYIWYPYAESPDFPIVGTGGRNAMAGPVFYADAYEQGPGTFPAYFDGKLFVYDWVRGWILIATMDAAGDLVKLEPFMPSTEFNNPIDMMFNDRGELYVLEYGTGWFSQNLDARLSRIEYNPGNRRPVVAAAVDVTEGAAPLTVHFSSAGSLDPDGDRLTYTWHMGDPDDSQASEPAPTFTYDAPGLYRPRLTVTDANGADATAELEVRVGNAPPVVELQIAGNRSFYWDSGAVDYTVSVSDPEDGSLEAGGIDEDDVFVTIDYLEEGFDRTLIEQGHRTADQATGNVRGARLIENSDCASCHTPETPSIGPSYREVAERYRGQGDAVNYLSSKIINGGSGVWGEQVMAAHPNLTEDEAASIARYILSVGAEQPEVARYPIDGTYVTNAHAGSDEAEGTYILRAAYTDSGAESIGPITGQAVRVLRHPRVQAEAFDVAHEAATLARMDEPAWVWNIYDGSYLGYTNIDLTGVEQVIYRVATNPLHAAGGALELRLDAPDGPVAGRVDVPASDRAQAFDVHADIEPTEGTHDVYFVATNPDAAGRALFMLDWIYFQNESRPLVSD